MPNHYFKKYFQTRVLVAVSICFFIINCSENNSNTKTPQSLGKLIYQKNCVICHGQEGTAGISGAKDLTVSPLSYKDKLFIVKNGKGAMAPFNGILTENEIEKVVDYVHKELLQDQKN